jgi:hypothetical protein
MADLDTLRRRGIPYRALVDGAGVAVSGTDTIRDLKDEGMEPICEVDETGTGVVGSETAATLRNRGIPVFCEVGEDGLASSGHTLPQLRDRGIPGYAIVGLDGIAQGGSLTIAQLRERGIASFCPVDEDGLETGLGTARITLTGQSIAEFSANGTTVGTLATVNTTGTAAFTLVDNAGGRFSLAGNLLKVADTTLIDYETSQFHSITVSVTGVTPSIANRTFLILVTDVVEPVIALTGATASEGATIGTTVGVLSILNSYTGSPVYTLADSAGGRFAISGANLNTAAVLDYETATSHSITVSVSGITPAAANGTFTITVTDVSVEPVIDLAGTTASEDAAVNTVVGTLSILNSYTGSPVYTLADSAGGKFNISGTSLRVNAALDYETATSHSVTVAVSGITPAAANKAFTVLVLDVTEVASTTWNSADKDANIALSGGDLVATKILTGGYSNVRTVASASTGKKYWELTVNEMQVPGSVTLGIANSTAALNGGAGYLGNDTNSAGVAGNGAVYMAGGVVSTIAGWAVGDTICFALDMDSSPKKIWFRTGAGNWNNDVLASQNPATGTGGISMASMAAGPYFPTGSIINFSDPPPPPPDQITANFGASAWFGAGPPSGFGAWGGGATTTTKNIVTDYGAVADAQWAQTTLSISTNVLASATPIWASGDVGKSIVVGEAGIAGPGGGTPLWTTITGFTSATQVTLGASCGNVLSSAPNVIVAWGTNNETAFINFRTAYQGQTVTLTIPAGVYLISTPVSGNFGGLFDGIRNITCNATGATLCGGAFQIQASAQYEAANHMGYTASVTAGATSVTLTTPSQVSRFVVGDYAMMTGFDMQHSGYPTNHSLWEYLLITAIDSDSGSPTYGKITFLTPLVNSYASTWPIHNAGGTNYGGPATLYAMNPKFKHICVVNGLTVAHHAQYALAGLNLTLNDCVFKGSYGPYPTMAKSVTLDNCTGLDATMEIDKLVTTFTMTGCTWAVLNMQSTAIEVMTLDNTDILYALSGSARKLVIQNGCNIASLAPGPGFYGHAHELVASNSVISSFTQTGGGAYIKGGGSADNGIHVDYEMAGGVITVPAAMRNTGVGKWAQTGEKMLFLDNLVGTIGSFTITNVTETSPTSDILVHTNWAKASGGFPLRTYDPSQGLFLYRHPAPICTFTSVTGCPEVVDLSFATAAGLPLNSYTRRTYTGSADNNHYIQMWGRFKYLKITVTTAYTGSIGTVTATINSSNGQPVKVADGLNSTWSQIINLKIAGVRTFDATAGTYPVAWTGAQTGDTLASQTVALWCGSNFVTTITDVSSDPGASPMEFTIELITDQGF